MTQPPFSAAAADPARRFFLAAPYPDAGAAPRLLAGEAEHATRVLRLGPGERVLGLDGAGTTWPLRIAAAGAGRGRELALEHDGEPWREPAPGEPGAPLPWIEVAVAWPRDARAEAMCDRLVQLGLAAIVPLVARQAGGGARSAAAGAAQKRTRLERVLREACKQSRRAWLPALGDAIAPAELAAAREGAPIALLDPHADFALDVWVRSLAGTPLARATPERPLVLAVGPEGGFDADERSALLAAGATPVRVGPHVLRIETAAEAALAIVAGALA